MHSTCSEGCFLICTTTVPFDTSTQTGGIFLPVDGEPDQDTRINLLIRKTPAVRKDPGSVTVSVTVTTPIRSLNLKIQYHSIITFRLLVARPRLQGDERSKRKDD